MRDWQEQGNTTELGFLRLGYKAPGSEESHLSIVFVGIERLDDYPWQIANGLSRHAEPVLYRARA